MNRHGGSLRESKIHFKMYKKGRNWVIAGITVTSISFGVLGLSAQTATATSDPTSVTTTDTAESSEKQVTLSSSVTPTATMVSNATDTDDTTAEDTDTSMASSIGTSSTLNVATSENESVNSDKTQSTTSSVVVSENETYDQTGSSNSETVQTTDLGDTDNVTFDTTKKVASENYVTTGQAQKITRVAAATKGVLTAYEYPDDFTINETPTGTNIADGMYGTSAWKITEDGTLSLGAGTITNNDTVFEDETGGDSAYDTSPWYDYAADIKTISFDGVVKGTAWENDLFRDLNHVTSIVHPENFDTSQITHFAGMFFKFGDPDQPIEDLDLNSWNVSNGIDFSSMFGYSNIKNLHIDEWDVSSGEYFNGMFRAEKGLTSLNLSNWDVSNGWNFSEMFQNATDLISLNVGNWVPSNGTRFSYMFDGTTALTSINLENWDVSKGQDFSWMFGRMSSMTNLDVSKWNVANGTDFSLMFAYSNKITSLEIGNWNVSNGKTFNAMFVGMTSLVNLPVSNWNVGNATNLYSLFAGDGQLILPDVSHWDVSKVKDFSDMFYGINIPTLDLSGWNTQSIINTDPSALTSPLLNMFGKMNNTTKIILSSGFKLRSFLPTASIWMNSQEKATWMAIGDGTETSPDGLLLDNTPYTGDPANADTYVLIRGYVDYIDTDTGDRVQRVIIPASVPQYNVVAPQNYELVKGQPDQITIRMAYTPIVYTVNLTHIKTSIPDEDQNTTTLTVNYVDQNGQSIKNSTTQTGKIGDDFTVTVPMIKGYTTTAQPVSGQFKGNQMTLTLNYLKDGVMPDEDQNTTILTVNYVDQDGQSIKNSTTQTGKIGDDFTVTVPTIKGYTTTAQPVSGQFKGNQMTLTLTYLKDGVVPDEDQNTTILTVNYVDQDGQSIQDSTTQTGKVGDNFIVDVPVIKGYTTTAQPVSGHFKGDQMTLTLTYLKDGVTSDESNTATDLTVHYVDQDGNVIAVPTNQSGKIGTDFTVTAPVITGYQLTDPKQATTTGQYQGDRMDLTLTYTKAATSVTNDPGKDPNETTPTEDPDTTEPGIDTTQPGDEPNTIVATPDDSTVVPETKDPDNGTDDSNVSDEPVITAQAQNAQAVAADHDTGITTDVLATQAVSVPAKTNDNGVQSTSNKVTGQTTDTAQLPQTSDSQTGLWRLIGVSLLSALGLMGIKKRTED